MVKYLKGILFATLLGLPLVASAAVTFVNSGVHSNVSGANDALPTIHASSTTGDLLLVTHWLIGDAAGEAVGTPSGWTLLETANNNGTGESVQVNFFCKIHDGSEPDPTFTTTGTGTGDAQGARIHTFRGTNQSCASIVAATNESSTAAATGLAHPSLTVSTANTMVVAFGAKRACEACVWDTLATDSYAWNEQWDTGGTGGDDWAVAFDYLIQTTAQSVSAGGWTATSGDESQIQVAIVLDLLPDAVPPTFSGTPSCSAASNGVSCTYTASATSTLYGVGVALADGAPTCTQIKAGQNDGGSAALATGSDANTGTADTISVTGTNPIAQMDYHFCLNNAGGDSAVDSSQVDELRSARAGFAFVTMASVSATGLCDLDSYFTPDCAVGDVFEYEDDTNEDADCNVSIGTDGDFVLTPVLAGDCDGRQTFDISYEDVSSATTGLFTAPTVGTFASDDRVYINNSLPDCNDDAPQVLVLLEDAAMTAIDLDNICTDADADALTYAVTSGTLPTGVTLNGGTGVISGTPTTEDENGEAIIITATDVASDTDGYAITIYVVNTWTVPDGVLDTIAVFSDAILLAAPWREFDIGLETASEACSDTVPEGSIISQDPAASAAATAFEIIEVVLSTGACSPPAAEEKIIFILTSVTGLVQWVDYIPVSEVPGCAAGRYDDDGCWAVDVLSSTTGKTAWVDYTPVFEVSQSANKWRYENDGWIPVNTLTP